MSPELPSPHQALEADLCEGALPDMIEVVRFAARYGRGPALVVSHRKMSGSLQQRLRRLANETDGA